MKWEVKYTANGEEHTGVIYAGPIRDAAMKAHALFVRPLKAQGMTDARIYGLLSAPNAAIMPTAWSGAGGAGRSKRKNRKGSV